MLRIPFVKKNENPGKNERVPMCEPIRLKTGQMGLGLAATIASVAALTYVLKTTGFLWVGAALSAYFAYRIMHLKRISQDGCIEVVEVTVTRTEKSGYRAQNIRYILSDGINHTYSMTTSKPQRYQEGAKLRVYYDRTVPMSNVNGCKNLSGLITVEDV